MKFNSVFPSFELSATVTLNTSRKLNCVSSVALKSFLVSSTTMSSFGPVPVPPPFPLWVLSKVIFVLVCSSFEPSASFVYAVIVISLYSKFAFPSTLNTISLKLLLFKSCPAIV